LCLTRSGLVRRRSGVSGLAGRAVARAVHLLVLGIRLVLAVPRTRTVAAVGPVEAGPLEHNADRGVHLAERAAACLAGGQRGVGELLDDLQPLITRGARVLVRRH